MECLTLYASVFGSIRFLQSSLGPVLHLIDVWPAPMYGFCNQILNLTSLFKRLHKYWTWLYSILYQPAGMALFICLRRYLRAILWLFRRVVLRQSPRAHPFQQQVCPLSTENDDRSLQGKGKLTEFWLNNISLQQQPSKGHTTLW